MLVNREESDNSIKCLYKSSNVLFSEYNKSTNKLNLIFNNGGSYIYEDVIFKDYVRLEIAESQGKVVNSTIKKYEFKKGNKVDTTEMLERVEKIIEEKGQP